MTMTSRERLLTVIRGDLPDCVPVAPDFSNMIPARLTGKPFRDLYAMIETARTYGRYPLHN